MHVWSHRPQWGHLGLFFAAYVLGCGFAQLLAIVPGTGISIWPPSGLFIATLVLASRPSWPWWVAAGCLAAAAAVRTSAAAMNRRMVCKVLERLIWTLERDKHYFRMQPFLSHLFLFMVFEWVCSRDASV